MDSPADVALNQVREICFRFPGTTEKLSHGAPSFFIRGKMFAMFADDHHSDDRIALWCKSTKPEQQRRVGANPKRFFVPPYVGVNGWVGVRVDAKYADWDELAIVVEEAWLGAAPASAMKDPVNPPPKLVPLAKTDPKLAKTALEKVKAICAELPESTCEQPKRHATFRVRKKVYAYFLDNHGGDGIVGVTWKATLREQAALIKSDPKRYYSPPYIGPRGWVAQRLDRRVDWKELADRLAASHASVAPKRVLAAKPSRAARPPKRRPKRARGTA